MQTEVTTMELQQALRLVSRRIIDSTDILTEADRNIGDGDHGLGMARGFEGVLALCESTKFNTIPELLKSCGDTLIDRMGGASGIVFGLMLRGGAKGAEASDRYSVHDLAAYFERSADAISERGRAQVGDKTMVDALVPANAALRSAADCGLPLAAALRAAATAAAAGREATKAYPAKFGKASTMGERTIGFPDAGAVSVAIIFETLADWAEQSA